MTKEEQLEDDFDKCFDKNTCATGGGYEADYTNQLGLWSSFTPYIKSFAIGFAEWVSKEGYREYDGPGKWISPIIHNNDILTTEQLYEAYLKQKS